MGHVGSDKQILLIDDDSLLIKVLSLLLTHNGFIVETAQTGAAGLAKAVRHEYDVIILDMGLPDQTGIAVCQKLRWNGVLTPILVLSGDTSKKTIVGGLKTGADDYLEKPFHEAELLERLNALIRRNERLFLSCILKFKSMELDTLNCTVQANYHSLKLTTIEMSVMRCLMQYAPRTVERNELFERVWGINDQHTSNRLEVYIKRLRQKLEKLDTGTTIQTVYGKGYRLK